MDCKYISENTFEHITLHDCVIDEVIIEEDRLKLLFEHIDVLLTHPLNNFDKPQCTGKAALIFENCTVLKSFVHDVSHVNGKQVIIVSEDVNIGEIEFNEMAKDMEILVVEIDDSNENIFQYKFLGNSDDGDFVEFVLKFSKVIICWDEFEGDAWFA